MKLSTKRKPAASNSLREKAYWQLKEAILAGDLPIEESLTEARLAIRLGASRTPVREALRRLESEGLVRAAHGRGIVIPSVTAELASEILEYREAVEGFAVRLATERMPDAALAKLGEACLRDPAPTAPDELNRIAAFFHDSIHDACGNPTLQRGIDRINDQLQRVRIVARSIPGRIELSYAERRPVAKAMLRRDPDAAETAMREHVRSTRNAIVQALFRYRSPR